MPPEHLPVELHHGPEQTAGSKSDITQVHGGAFRPFKPATFRHTPRVPYDATKKHIPGQPMPLWDFAEHGYIGDHIGLRFNKSPPLTAYQHIFTLPNGLPLTYGQINGLAGDFYGTNDPICDGVDDADKADRFQRAWNTLATSNWAKDEATNLLSVLEGEVKMLEKAVEKGQKPSEAYHEYESGGHGTWVDAQLQWYTQSWARYLDNAPAFFELTRINFDHFGRDARKTYIAGHGVALEAAKKGDLEKAYTLNAFADHYLQDSFSAGHLRTPRRWLHDVGGIMGDKCAEDMHDEDNAIGLTVKNKSGKPWTIYGDTKLLDPKDEVAMGNYDRCHAALQASADEIWDAYANGKVPTPIEYRAFNHTPTIESAEGPQELVPLFKPNGQRRKDIFSRRNNEYTAVQGWGGIIKTAADIKLSDWWDYPITLDGPSS